MAPRSRFTGRPQRVSSPSSDGVDDLDMLTKSSVNMADAEDNLPVEKKIIFGPKSVQARKQVNSQDTSTTRKRVAGSLSPPVIKKTKIKKSKDVSDIFDDSEDNDNGKRVSEADEDESTPVEQANKATGENVSNAPKDQDPVVYYEDLYPTVKKHRNGPTVCEVTKEDLFDLQLEGTYTNLPPLWSASLQTANNGPNPAGAFQFSEIVNAYPNLDVNLIKTALTFVSAGIFVNPSRASPSLVKRSTPDPKYTNIYALRANSLTNFGYTVFTTVILADSCNLVDYGTNSQYRSITGTLCTLEWERFCAFFPMVFREPNLYARIYEDAVSFSTRAKTTSTAAGASTGRALSKRFGKANNPTKSPVKVVGSPLKTSSVKGALNFDDPVPIYDGTNGNLNMNELHLLHNQLGPWGSNLENCICLVAYTANVYEKDAVEKNLSLNIQWVVVLADLE